MLLLHQAGSVKIGEVVRYTVTYTPADDRILPSPPFLFLKIKNTSALPLRAAFVHGPYALYVSSCPSTFQPNEKFENPRRDGVPEFEHNLKAGATWFSQLHVPEHIRETAGSAKSHLQRRSLSDENPSSVSWIIEVASQVIFSNSATVHYEILLGRDEKSLSLGFAGLTGSSSATPAPGQVSDHQQSQGAKDGHHNAQAKGVYSRAIKLKVDDTASLWNTPKLPQWDEDGDQRAQMKNPDAPVERAINEGTDMVDDNKGKKQKKVHLVILTHGLHSNLGADMLYLKESIDAGARQAKIDARARRNARREEAKKRSSGAAKAKRDVPIEIIEGKVIEEEPLYEEPEEDIDETDDEEEVIVRGFSGNAVRTEKGIKYLGKRLAKYILATTYPDQPFLPIGKNHTKGSTTKSDSSKNNSHHLPVHAHSTIHRESYHDKKLAYKITSISFIAHSLGGLIQTYAVAYVQKHSPHFFDTIKPINFIAMASPFLGLSNENPLYVKFALDFGFVGRTGQDLGLTWRPPTIARSGWGAIVSGMSEKAHKKAEEERDPGSKPLLRILPTGPAHIALKKFRNRTLYSNVVNDGIVPLRTSCLLFLDWRGLDRVEKARRENGLVGTVAGLAWAEITGSSSSTSSRRQWKDKASNTEDASDTDGNSPTRHGKGAEVPQPAIDATDNDDTQSLRRANSNLDSAAAGEEDAVLSPTPASAVQANTVGPLDSILGLFRTNPSPKPQNHSPKYSKIYKRSQTINFSDASSETSTPRSSVKSGGAQDESTNLSAPPKTTIFESAGDILSPPVPSISFLIDPASRSRTIFHDRVYHPADIPPPPTKRSTRSPTMLLRRLSSSGSVPQTPGSASTESASSSRTNSSLEGIDSSSMKVEEKIARAYHRDLSWRKVLVRLEPDAHNNMVVRRQFANAYGWPVVKHLVDTHFSDSVVAAMRDDDEDSLERAKDMNEKPTSHGSEIKDPAKSPVEPHRFIGHHVRTDSEARESADHVPPLGSMHSGTATGSHSGGRPHPTERKDSAQWSDRDFVDSEEDSDGDESEGGNVNKALGGGKGGWNWTEAIVGKGATAPRGGTSKKDIDAFLGKGPGHVAQTKGAVNLEAVANGSVEARRAAAEGFGAGTTAVGLGKNISAVGDTSEGVSEQVARMSLGADSV